MKKITLPMIAMLFLALSLGLQSCEKTVDVKEYIADDNTFVDFLDWTLKATINGADPSLNGAHGGGSEHTVRTIYFKDNASKVDGEFPIGTVINKLSHNDTTGLDMRTGMVKRGNDFDKDNGDWEYFIIAADGSIASRGDSEYLSCFACHVGAKSKDYIFTE